ncbi:helix-turn-helix domain-containing protein [Corallococcus sicarius]|uniref:XRE family transcriptional regulator n=1 Tax=Corallococcus sicarius TaxID=2316726 RepID=A0A3A8NN67_9BACT|nr:helix-turn-helix transcriptional regulator [Corallococcus sicarius]RKH44810.1 XRE family transcriptional regulator [Corallococcus sicarius]
MKKIIFSKEWCASAAASEASTEVGAGLSAFASTAKQAAALPQHESDESRIAFGRLVQLMRRKRGLTLEDLEKKADIDLEELVNIEEGTAHIPEPRTVYQLAQFFKVPSKGLLQLSGLSTTRDDRIRHEAVRFAARSESVAKLTSEETAALESFIAVLSSQR